MDYAGLYFTDAEKLGKYFGELEKVQQVMKDLERLPIDRYRELKKKFKKVSLSKYFFLAWR